MPSSRLVQEPATAEVLAFVASSFRSAWAVELLRLLRSQPDRIWTQAHLVSHLRASELVVRQSVQALTAVGLVAPREDGTVHYAAPPSLEPMLLAVERLYLTAPDTVRRVIVRGNSHSMTAFSRAFRLRSED